MCSISIDRMCSLSIEHTRVYIIACLSAHVCLRVFQGVCACKGACVRSVYLVYVSFGVCARKGASMRLVWLIYVQVRVCARNGVLCALCVCVVYVLI